MNGAIMRVLVTGGHGFIGRYLRREIAATGGHEVVALSRRDGFDLTDSASTLRHLRDFKPQVIFNCAAHMGSLHYVSEFAADVLQDNVAMALNLYRAAQDCCPDATIINPLANCSYPGDAEAYFEEQWWNGPVHESVFSYGNTRRMVYVTAWCFRRQYRLRSVNFLVPNTFGPGDSTDPNRTHAINGMIIRMLQAHREGAPEFEIWGTGAPVREWAFVEDVARVLVKGMFLEQDLEYPVNVAQNRGYSIRESAEIIARHIGFGGRLVFNPDFADGAPKKVMDDRRFRQLFPDFEFMTSHDEGIRRTIEYYAEVL
jgi:GDP-L-fucose synthase